MRLIQRLFRQTFIAHASHLPERSIKLAVVKDFFQRQGQGAVDLLLHALAGAAEMLERGEAVKRCGMKYFFPLAVGKKQP